MNQSIEEEEVTAQRDAAVSLFKGLQQRIRTQAAEYEARTEAAEMGRIQAEIELEQLQREESGSAMTARAQVRTVTQGWAVGVVLGWSAGLLVGCLFSPVLGFMIVLPFVAAGVMGGLTYAQLRDKMRSLQREKGRQVPGAPSEDKEEFLRQLQGRSDPSATGAQHGCDGSGLPPGSFLRKVAMGAAQALVRSAVDATVAGAASMLGFGGKGGGGGGAGGGGGRDFGRTGARRG